MSERTISANNDDLFKQTTTTADHYMRCAVRDIDKLFGNGYAKAHPELIAGYMHAAASDIGCAIIARAIEGIDSLTSASDDIASAIGNAADDLARAIKSGD